MVNRIPPTSPVVPLFPDKKQPNHDQHDGAHEDVQESLQFPETGVTSSVYPPLDPRIVGEVERAVNALINQKKT